MEIQKFLIILQENLMIIKWLDTNADAKKTAFNICALVIKQWINYVFKDIVVTHVYKVNIKIGKHES